VAQLFVLGLVIAAASAGWLVWAQLQLLKNLEAAWPERQEVARQAGDIERDDRAPERVRAIAKLLADNAFDDDFIRRLRGRAAAAQGRSESSRLLRQMKAQFGERYGDKLYKLVNCFAGITFFIDLSEGRRMKGKLTQQQLKDLRRVRSREVFEALNRAEKTDKETSGSPAAA
jgi:hypothetical protein